MRYALDIFRQRISMRKLMDHHTSYLSFLLHRQDFRKPNFTPKKTTKGTKNTKNVSEKVKCMQFFFNSIWKNLHLTGNFYTGTACGACDKYEVWLRIRLLQSRAAQIVGLSRHMTLFRIIFSESVFQGFATKSTVF